MTFHPRGTPNYRTEDLMSTSIFRLFGVLLLAGMVGVIDASAQGPFESMPEGAVQLQIVATGNNNGELEECG
jgi:hypothetical protein